MFNIDIQIYLHCAEILKTNTKIRTDKNSGDEYAIGISQTEYSSYSVPSIKDVIWLRTDIVNIQQPFFPN